MVGIAKYEVASRLGKMEVRRYSPLVVARVEDHGDRAFGLLFRYIQGNNRRSSKVAMTAPVISERGRGDTDLLGRQRIAMTAPVISDEGTMAFVMPEGYTLASTPEPMDPRVRIRELPARTLAVLRFSGRWSRTNFDDRSHQLLEELEAAGIRALGQVFSMVYNPPFTPWFMRRNEVGVEVDPEAGRGA